MSTDRKAMTRIWKLADEGSFVEFGRNVAQRSTDFTSDTEKPAGDGVITGTASVNGVTVAIYAQDAETLGGSLGEMHARKIEAVYEFALKAACPVIGLLDSAGIRLSEATDALEGLGRIYSVMAKASGRVPTVLALFGRTGGGMAVMAGLADFVFMSKDAELFVNAPNTLDGNYREKCDTASADYQAEESGTADFTGTEDEVLGKIQELFWMLPANADDRPFQESGDDLNRTTEELSGEIDVRKILTTLSDDLVFTELKSRYAPSVVTGFSTLGGMPVAWIGTDGERLSAKGLRKAAGFLRFADAFSLPVVTLSGADGFETNEETEKELVRASAEYLSLLSSATVPKINVFFKDVYGSAYAVLNSKAAGADLVFAFPGVKIGIMKAESAARILGGDDLSETARRFDERQTALQAASRGYIDEIVEPASLRKYLILSLQALSGKRAEPILRKRPGK